MKKYFLVLLLITFASKFSLAQESKIQWNSIAEGFKKNKTSDKLIFIDVYTTWCIWCIRMDESTFLDPKIADKLNNYFIPIKFNAESNDSITYAGKVYINPNPFVRRNPHPFAKLLLGERHGYPSFAILDKNLNLIGVLQGFQTVEKLDSILDYFLSNKYSEMTYEEWLEKTKL